MKVRVSIVYEFERKDSYMPCTKSSAITKAFENLNEMSYANLKDLCRVQVAKETWLDVEE